MMRKVRDYDAELKALGDKARTLKAKKVQQLGELVMATGADTLDPNVLAGALIKAVETEIEGQGRGAKPALPSFNDARKNRAHDLVAIAKAMLRNERAIRRIEASMRRSDTRVWVMQRRERTRHLIELGGLVQKAGLVELTDDDRATLYGAMLDLAGRAQGEGGDMVLALWKRRGKRAFSAEEEGEHNP